MAKKSMAIEDMVKGYKIWNYVKNAPLKSKNSVINQRGQLSCQDEFQLYPEDNSFNRIVLKTKEENKCTQF